VNWAKIDDGFYDHPKVLVAGEEAANLYLRGLVWCCKHLTDGAIPREALRTLTGRRDAAALAAKLVASGLWEARESGWAVHDFHDHNPTAAEVKARRAELSAKRAEAGKRGGIRSGQVRVMEANAKQTASKPEASCSGVAEAKRSPVPSRPVPIQEEEGYPHRLAADDGTEGGPQSAEDAPSGGSPIVDAAEVEAALHAATGGALRLAAAPSTQSAAIVRHLRAAGVTRAELVHVTAALRDPGAIWDWAKGVKVTAGWLAGKPHPGTHEHDCSRLQEVVAHARAIAAKAAREEATRAPIARPSTPAEDPATAGARARAILSTLRRTQPS
jgi:putative intracellular protease/amidase